MSNGKSYKLASKYSGNMGKMILQLPNGEFFDVAMIMFPNDGQLHDNYDFMKDLEKLYHTRIRKSI